MSQENTEAQFFALAVLATLPPEWGPSTIAKIVCRLEPRKFDRTDLKSLCLTAPSVALLASIHSWSCKLSLGLIWLKPDKELGQWPLAARQSVSRTPAELWNINKQGELAKHYLVLAFDLFWVRLLVLVLGLNTRARRGQWIYISNQGWWWFNSSVVSDSWRPHRLQYTRLSCLSPSPGVCSDSMSIELVMPPNHLRMYFSMVLQAETAGCCLGFEALPGRSGQTALSARPWASFTLLSFKY